MVEECNLETTFGILLLFNTKNRVVSEDEVYPKRFRIFQDCIEETIRIRSYFSRIMFHF